MAGADGVVDPASHIAARCCKWASDWRHHQRKLPRSDAGPARTCVVMRTTARQKPIELLVPQGSAHGERV